MPPLPGCGPGLRAGLSTFRRPPLAGSSPRVPTPQPRRISIFFLAVAGGRAACLWKTTFSFSRVLCVIHALFSGRACRCSCSCTRSLHCHATSIHCSCSCTTRSLHCHAASIHCSCSCTAPAHCTAMPPPFTAPAAAPSARCTAMPPRFTAAAAAPHPLAALPCHLDSLQLQLQLHDQKRVRNQQKPSPV